jgi:hypothetical protein
MDRNMQNPVLCVGKRELRREEEIAMKGYWIHEIELKYILQCVIRQYNGGINIFRYSNCKQTHPATNCDRRIHCSCSLRGSPANLL